jgi:hypothetical protein
MNLQTKRAHASFRVRGHCASETLANAVMAVPRNDERTAMEDQMTENDVAKLTPQQRDDAVIFAVQRWRANMLYFSDLCEKTACRRARTCSADPDDCIGHLAPFVPDDVRKGVDALLEAKIDGLTFAEVRARIPWAVDAHTRWLAKINESRFDRAYARRHPKRKS